MAAKHPRPEARSRRRSRPAAQVRILDHSGRRRIFPLAGKTSIGAAEACTLQLPGPDMHPVHCLIIQGARQTVVRNLSPGNTLNGRAFTDARLRPGDRLQVGSYEVQYLMPDPDAAPRGSSSRGTASRLEARLDRLEARLFEVQRDQAVARLQTLKRTVRGLRERLVRQRQRHREQRQTWREEEAVLVARMDAQAQQLEQLAQQANRWQREAAQTTPAADTQMFQQEIAQLQESLQNTQRHQQAQQNAWSQERQTLESELSRAQQRLEELQAELQAARDQQSDRDEQLQWKQQAHILQQELAAVTHELDEVRRGHEAERSDWEHARHDLESRLADLSTQREDALRQLRSKDAELVQLRRELEQAVARWEDERSQKTPDPAALPSGPQGSEATDSAAANEGPGAGWQPPAASSTQEIDELVEHTLPAVFQPAHEEDGETDWRTEWHDSPARTVPVDETMRFAGGVGSQPQLLQHERFPENPAMPATEPGAAAGASASDNAASGGGAKLMLRDGQELHPEVPAEEPAMPLAWHAETEPNASEPSSAVSATREEQPTAEDDSIEAYMDRLLARVRGESQSPAGSTVRPAACHALPNARVEPVPAAQPAAGPTEAHPGDSEPPVEEAGEFLPRRQAPECGISLEAMRSLANESARSAIKSHAERNWTEAAKYQLFAASLGFTCGLATFISLDNHPLVGFGILLAGLSVGVIFTRDALRVRRALLQDIQQVEDQDENE